MSREPDISIPPIIVRGDSFTIYGEIHNDIDNRFYEKMIETFDENDRILVEHTTYKPFLEKEDMALRMTRDKKGLIANMKGSEWIYFTRLVEGKQIEAIDIRVENGFPSAQEESSLSQIAETKPLQFLTFITGKLKVIIDHKQSYNKPGIKEVFNSIHPVLKVQIKTFFENVKEGIVDLENVYKICTNFKYLCTLFVDSNLLDIILENNGKRKNKKKLVIFVGARHAINLFNFLTENGVNVEIQKTEKGEVIEPCRAI